MINVWKYSEKTLLNLRVVIPWCMNFDICNKMDHLAFNAERRNSETYIEQNYILENNHYGDEVLSCLNSFREQWFFTDAILVVDNKEFPCHRNVLAVSSPYFKAMFTTDLRESKEMRIAINEISASTMGHILDYAYTGRMEITVDNAQEILAAGNLFQYPAIVDAGCEFLSRHLHPSNCLGIEIFAQLHSCKDLENQAHQFTLDNFSAVVEYDEFLDLSLDRLIIYVASDLIDVRTEETVYDAVMRWVHHDLDNRKLCLCTVLENVRLATVDVHYLEEVIERDPLIQSIDQCRNQVEDAKRYHETCSQGQQGQRRRSMQTESTTPRPSTVAKEVMVLVGGIKQVNSVLNMAIQTMEMYDPHKDKWYPLPDLPDDVTWFGAAALDNDIYVSGGIQDNQLVSTVWRFDSAHRQWHQVRPMLQQRARHASAAWNNQLYVLGGVNVIAGDRRLVAVETIECYNSESGEWTLVGSSPMPRKLSNVVPYKKTLVEIGGTQSGARVQTMESYFCSESQVKYSGEQFVLPEAIQFSQIVVLNSVFYIIWEDSKKVISLNPDKRTFRRLPDMHYAHVHSGATVLNGKIYIAGGLVDSKPSRVIECYDPTANTWTLVKSMKQARACHGCVTLQMCWGTRVHGIHCWGLHWHFWLSRWLSARLW